MFRVQSHRTRELYRRADGTVPISVQADVQRRRGSSVP